MKIENCKLKIAKHKGFTLIELLITIFFVSVGLIGVIAFFNASLQSQFDAKSEVIAAGLAQEGTELVRNIVDYNFLNDEKWWNEIATNDNGNSNCSTIDYVSLTDHKCIIPASGKKKEIFFNGSRYRQANSGENGNTIFMRGIDISPENMVGPAPPPPANISLDNGDCLKVVSTVTWSDRETKATDIICKPRQ